MGLKTSASHTVLGLAAVTALAVSSASAAAASQPAGAALASVPGPESIEVNWDGDDYAKVYKNVWKRSNSFINQHGFAAGAPSHRSGIYKVGELGSGSNYFYCQVKTDMTRRASDGNGSYVNNWWLLTDDDSGNENVWVNAVNVSGGGNYERIPGVPDC